MGMLRGERLRRCIPHLRCDRWHWDEALGEAVGRL